MKYLTIDFTKTLISLLILREKKHDFFQFNLLLTRNIILLIISPLHLEQVLQDDSQNFKREFGRLQKLLLCRMPIQTMADYGARTADTKGSSERFNSDFLLNYNNEFRGYFLCRRYRRAQL